MAKIGRERVERAARIYSSNQEAGQALGIVMQSFGRLCREYGIETPYARRRRLRQRRPSGANQPEPVEGGNCDSSARH